MCNPERLGLAVLRLEALAHELRCGGQRVSARRVCRQVAGLAADLREALAAEVEADGYRSACDRPDGRAWDEIPY